ncbi:hypothetical protein DJ84_17940 [Halorubrum ezzemoulense]|nr:hypothetical protein DJ84_17940 [Halorubrum ezzemoulense]
MRLRGRRVSFWLLLLLLGQLTVRALVGGTALLIVPSGELVGLPAGPLDNAPIENFILPGLALFLLFGVVSSIVCYGLYTRRRWARPGAIGVALALLVWVAVEVAVGFSRPTVYLNVATAVGVLGVALSPTVRADLRDESA